MNNKSNFNAGALQQQDTTLVVPLVSVKNSYIMTSQTVDLSTTRRMSATAVIFVTNAVFVFARK